MEVIQRIQQQTASWHVSVVRDTLTDLVIRLLLNDAKVSISVR